MPTLPTMPATPTHIRQAAHAGIHHPPSLRLGRPKHSHHVRRGLRGLRAPVAQLELVAGGALGARFVQQGADVPGPKTMCLNQGKGFKWFVFCWLVF